MAGTIVAAQPEAAEAGALILSRGGNAVDAAVACALVQGVVDPQMVGIAGFGTVQIYMPSKGVHECIDFHGTCPGRSTPEMWEHLLEGETRDGFGFLLKGKINDAGYASVAVPGSLRAYEELAGYGRFAWKDLLAPAIRLAREGVAVEDDLADSLPQGARRLGRWPASRPIFFKADGAPLGPGDRLVQAAVWIVLVVGLFEYGFLKQFVRFFDILGYYVSRGTVQAAAAEMSGDRLFASGMRYEGRTLLPMLGEHRVSSVFLEPVSVGNFGAICFSWIVLRDWGRPLRMFARLLPVVAFLGAVLVLARICDDEGLFDALGTHLVAFGEWCAARHSLDYATLPDWWMLFDVYDRQEQRFWSTTRRNAWAAEMGFKTVPRLYAGEVTLDQLRDWVHAHDSQFRQGHLEGIVVRRENADWLENRAKLVRADFTQTIEAHWKSRALEWNRVV